MKCAIYLRQSLDRSGDGLAIDRQRVECLSLVQSKGWEVFDEYVDNSRSASKRTVRRPEYERMISDYTSGRFGAIVAYDLDRLTRQPRQLEDLIDLAEERGLIVTTANGEADLSTDGGRMYARIKASVARAEIERKSARQKLAAAQRADRGLPPAGVRLTGYNLDGGIVKSEAELVRFVFREFHKKEPLTRIASRLNSGTIPPRDGGSWTPSTVRTMLMNPRYAGRQIHRGKVTGKSGNWPAIVSEDLFDAVQVGLSDPRRKKNREGTARKYLGAGLYECALCREAKAYSPTVKTNGKRYACREGHLIRTMEPIDRLVLDAIERRLSQPDVSRLIAPRDDARGRALDATITALRDRLAKIEGDYDAGLIDGQRYNIARSKVLSDLSTAERERADLIGNTTAAEVLAAHSPTKAFRAASLAVQRAVIDSLAWVIIYPARQGLKGFDPASVAIAWKTVVYDTEPIAAVPTRVGDLLRA